MGPVHYSIGHDVHLHLNAKYGQQWIERSGPVHWPSRSPELTSLDFWEYVKTLVYKTPVNGAEELIANIVVATGEIPEHARNFRQYLIFRPLEM